ncbi:membrane protein [Rugosimonospora acidiphila]|uniref:Membrane protein n=1 Tax=Rugosimonospora acidiphila TaxID=556531 RepID=A0ABP9RLF4_9ACTN
MLTRLLCALGRWAQPRLARAPWGSGLGLARTVLAVGTLATLLATSPRVLMSPLSNGVIPPICGGIAKAGVWCVIPAGHGEAARWLSITVLLLTASGWRPRVTGALHWYVAWSLMANATIQDGGDQITAVLTLVLVPVTLTDSRRWHWQRPPEGTAAGTGRVVAYACLILAQIQMAVLYFQASVAKLGVREWADGTAMFYWFRNQTFGAPGWLRPLTDAVTSSAISVSLLTWASIAIEFALAVAILLRPPAKRLLLAAGLLFHDAIAVSMGLISFDVAMSAGLLLYLLPIGHQVAAPRWLPWLRGRLAPLTGRLGRPGPARSAASRSAASRPAAPEPV